MTQNENLKLSISGLYYGLSGLYAAEVARKQQIGTIADEATAETIYGSINALTSRVSTIEESIGSEGNIANQIAEISGAVSTLINNIGDSEDESTDNTVYGTIAKEYERAYDIENALSTAISGEIIRATDAEETIAGNLSNEVTRATGAESAISAAFDAEVTRATGAEETIADDLADEVTRAKGAEAFLSGKIDEINGQSIAGTNAISITGQSAKEVSLLISAYDKVLTQDTNGLLANVSLSALGAEGEYANRYQLVGKDGQVLGDTINIAKDQFLSAVTYDSNTQVLSFDFEVLSGSKHVDIPISGLVDIYTEGNGIDITNNVVSVVKDPGSESFLTVSEDGVKIDGISSFVATSIEAEETRATAAEETIAGNLLNEVTRATGAESAISAAFDAEVTRATGAEDAISAAFDAEVIRATGAESAISAAFDAEVTRATGTEDAISAAFDAEVTRATGAESAISAAFDAEVTRATSAEGAISAAFDAEVTRATGAEETIAGNLSNEVTRATAAEAALSAAVDTRFNTINTELAQYVTAIEALNVKIDTLNA